MFLHQFQKTLTFHKHGNSHSLLFAPTQVGKTAASTDLMELVLKETSWRPIIVSCDNKTSQLDQFFHRVKKRLDHLKVVFLRVDETTFDETMTDAFRQKRKVIIFTLDNYIQLKKLKERLVIIYTLQNVRFRSLVLFHDEADVITKDPEIKIPHEPTQSKSHFEWLDMMRFLDQRKIVAHRVFITATPENVVYKYKILNILSIPVPPQYIGYRQIQGIPMETVDDIRDILIDEQNRRFASKESGVILYCVDKSIEKGHEQAFESVCSYLDCVVSVYNGNGIQVRIPESCLDVFCKLLKQFVATHNAIKGNTKIKGSALTSNIIKYGMNIENMAMSDFYELCKQSGEAGRVIVTIGMDLMARGISFVSTEKTPDAIAATTMIYKPGNTMHAVGICQAIGRITGMARPDLERRLYAPQAVLNTYRHYNDNQLLYMKELKDKKGVESCEAMKQIQLNTKLPRKLDRPQLKLNPQFRAVPLPVPEEDINEKEKKEKTIDGMTLDQITKTKDVDNLTADQQIVRAIVESLKDKKKAVALSTLQKGVKEKIPEGMSLDEVIIKGCDVSAEWGKIWIYEGEKKKKITYYRG